MLARSLVAFALTITLSSPAAAEEPAGRWAAGRWAAGSPDAMIDASRHAARASSEQALARLLVIEALAEEATAGTARGALAELGTGRGPLAAEARWLARTLEPSRMTSWTERAGQLDDTATPHPGLVRTWAVLGPFEDTGGGLDRREGPETEGHRFVGADYSWGVYAVRPVRSLVGSVDARGLPLDLYVHPRRESCTYLSTVVTTPGVPFVVHLASTGAVRLLLDGQEIFRDESVHARAMIDRASLTLTGPEGDHELTAKICSSARPDAGRLRLRFSKPDGTDLALPTSSALGRLDATRADPTPGMAVASHPTLLSRATRIDGPSASSEAVLTAATVHILAGTDDLRSQRAPGLLDRLVGAPTLRADHLAMAGWLTSFVANKSGWLRQAQRQAMTAGDTATADFAQRALVQSQLRIGSLDLARATAAAPPFSEADDPHARWLRAQIDASEGGAGLSHKALGELEALAAELTDDTPMVVWRSLARLASGTRSALALGAMQQLAAGLPGQRDPRFAAAFSMLGAPAVEQAALAMALHQPSASDLAALGSLLLRTGRYVAAAEIFELATGLSPNLAAGHQGLASARQSLAPTAPASERVREPLARAAELEPEDNRLAAELRYRRGESSGEPELGDDAEHIVDAPIFLRRAAEDPAPAEGLHSRQLHWRRVVRLHPDKRVSQLMHYAREIIIEPRTERERYEDVPGGYGTELLIARVHRDGAVLPPEEKDASGMVRWPDLERGDVVEIAVRNWTPGPVGRRGDRPFFFVDYVGSVDTQPVLYNEVVIDAPIGSPFAFDVIGGKADERSQTERDGRRITRLVWHRPATVPQEPFSPPVTEIVPVVVGSIYPSWDAFLAWYRGAVEGFTNPDEQIKRLAQEITAKARTRDEKIEALFDFVADDIRYVNYVSGEWWLPNRPQQLLARRQGDCDDKAMLLISLLRSIGIEAKEVLIQTRHTAQRRVMQSDRVAVPLFDHGIIYLPDEDGEGGRYLDATSPKSRMGSLPAMDSGAMAMLVEDGNKPIMTPLVPAEAHGAHSTWTLLLDPDGSGRLKAVEIHVGDDAFRLRTHLAEEDTRAQWIEQNLIDGWFSGLTMSPDVGFDSDLPEGRARVTYEATSSSLARREGQDLVVEITPPMPIASILAPLPERKLPVELPPSIAPHHREHVVRIRVPNGYRVAELPPDDVADGGAFGRAEVSFERQGDREVVMKRSLALAAPRIAVADYPAWRRWLQRVDGLMRRQVRLVPR